MTCALVTVFGAGRHHGPGSREDTGKLEGEGKLLREEGLAGATALRGIEGFGATSRLHTARILRLSEDLPIVIEGADTAERIEAIMPKLDEMVTEGMVTMERVEVVSYRAQSTQGDQGA
ncbi:MAG TPA: DUF190 domain-containing protein [Solirubrobacterales bacterium]